MKQLFSLHGKNALVTGASRGLGQAIAMALASAGAAVVCASSRPGGTDETVKRIQQSGQQAWSVAADMSEKKQVYALAAEVEKLAGSIDILVNNAGTIERYPAVNYPDDVWNRIIDTNLNSVFILSRTLGAKMLERGSGKIINIASLLSFTGGIMVPAYTASKHAVAGLTKALANEWGSGNVQVNAIAPGYFKTDNTEVLLKNAERNAQITARIPAGRWGEPDDIAGAVIFLASNASDYVNGHILSVDGGWMAR